MGVEMSRSWSLVTTLATLAAMFLLQEAQSKLTIPYGHPKTRRALICNHLITNGPHYAVKSIYLLSQRREGKNSAPVENQASFRNNRVLHPDKRRKRSPRCIMECLSRKKVTP